MRGTDDVAGSGDIVEDRFTRAISLKLAVIGAASLSLGLWRAPVAGAQSMSLSQCLASCVVGYNSGLQFSLGSCQKAFAPTTLAKNPRWRRFRRRLRGTPVGWKSVVDQLRSNCYAKAHSEYREGLKKCERRCGDLCPRRSVQSASSTTAPTCEYTPPPKPSPPAVPPPPAAEGGPCSSCALVTPSAFCDECPTVDSGFICCALPAVGGKSPCCP